MMRFAVKGRLLAMIVGSGVPATMAIASDATMSFHLGKSLFEKLWVSSPSSTTASDGLGPLYNARSCAGCHINSGRGSLSDQAIGLIMRLSLPTEAALSTRALQPDPIYGTQLQPLSVAGLAAEGELTWTFHYHKVSFADGEEVELRRPIFQIDHLQYGALDPSTQHSPRLAPPLFGAGLLEAIRDEDIRQNAQSDQWRDWGIKGKLNLVWDKAAQEWAIGRFGWKAQHPTLWQQNAAALHEDLGLSNELFPDAAGGCTARQTACLARPNGNSPHTDGFEISSAMMTWLQQYTRHLPSPSPAHVSDTDPNVAAGAKIFAQIGCQACHRPTYMTQANAPIPLANQQIWPYTDMLLHDMGEGLADNVSEFAATGAFWRTAPLWGLSRPKNPQQGSLLHDGRARTLQEAILWHGGEAEQVKQHYMRLPRPQRQQLLHFIETR